jgi:ribonuclease HI
MTLNPDEGIALYTDGSCYYKDKSGGWAWLALDAYGEVEYGHGGCTGVTNNQMEMRAITEGINWLFETLGAIEILVRSDSEYVVLGMQFTHRARNKNVKYWKKLEAAVAQHEYVEFEHVKGHAGNEYNEHVDRLAGMARKGQI